MFLCSMVYKALSFDAKREIRYLFPCPRVHQERGLAKLVAWIKELRKKYLEREWIIYEDRARSHWSSHNASVFKDNNIAHLKDLLPHTLEGNAIKQAWSWERKDITLKEGQCRGVSSD